MKIRSNRTGVVARGFYDSRDCDGQALRYDVTELWSGTADGSCDEMDVLGTLGGVSRTASCSSETEFEATAYLGSGCNAALVQDEKRGDFSDACNIDFVDEKSYSYGHYSYSYGDVEGYVKWGCPQLEADDWIQLSLYPFGTCDDESYVGRQLWSKACFQSNPTIAMAYTCDAVDGFGIAMWIGDGCDGEPWMTLTGDAWPFSGEPGTCLNFAGLPFAVSCSCTFCGNVVDAAPPAATHASAAAVAAASAAALLF